MTGICWTALAIAYAMRWVKLTLPCPTRFRWLFRICRLTSSSLAATVRTEVAVGTWRLASMFSTMRAAEPRSGAAVSPSMTGGGAAPPVFELGAGLGSALPEQPEQRWRVGRGRCLGVRSRRRSPATRPRPSPGSRGTGGTSLRRARSSGPGLRTCRSGPSGWPPFQLSCSSGRFGLRTSCPLRPALTCGGARRSGTRDRATGALSRGSHMVSYRCSRWVPRTSSVPPRHSVTFSPVSSTWTPPGHTPTLRHAMKNARSSAITSSKCRVL